MKKRYSIGFLIISLVLLVGISGAYQISYEKAKERAREEQVQIKNEIPSVSADGEAMKADCYYLMEVNGYVAVFCSDKMSKRIFIVVCCNFRVSGRTGGKEHEHWLVAAGRVVPARIAAGKQVVFRIEIVPAFPAAANHDLCQLHPGVGLCNVDMVRSIAVCRAENCTDARCLEAVREIMLHKLIGSRNRNGADLVQTQNGKPELVMPLEHEHHAVAASDAERGKVIGGLAGSIFHVLECEPPLRSIRSHMQHGELFRLFTAQHIHNVKRPVGDREDTVAPLCFQRAAAGLFRCRRCGNARGL